jgi:hypothetical protein
MVIQFKIEREKFWSHLKIYKTITLQPKIVFCLTLNCRPDCCNVFFSIEIRTKEKEIPYLYSRHSIELCVRRKRRENTTNISGEKRKKKRSIK